MKEAIKVKRQDVEKLVNASFSTYRGRKFKIYAQSYVSLQDLNWSGGSRSEYIAVSLDGTFLGSCAKYNAAHPWSHAAEGKSIDIPRGACVIRHSIFLGKDMGLTFYIHPEDMPKLLKNEAVS